MDPALRFILALLSITRWIAKRLIACGWIHDFGSMLIWNSLFYILIVLSFFAYALSSLDITSSVWISAMVAALSIIRVNELVFAFYGDALPKKLPQSKNKLPINSRERILLLTFAYIEIIFLFALLYYALQNWLGAGTFSKKFQSVWDALYFSGVTITTTGYGDFSPKFLLAKFCVVYETLIGVVFIALVLAAYIGARQEANGSEAHPPSASQT